MFKVMILHALGIPSKEAKEFVPQSEWRKMFWWSRVYLLVYAGMIGLVRLPYEVGCLCCFSRWRDSTAAGCISFFL